MLNSSTPMEFASREPMKSEGMRERSLRGDGVDVSGRGAVGEDAEAGGGDGSVEGGEHVAIAAGIGVGREGA